MTEPASIRFNNPGAMWGGNVLTKKWGEISHVTLNDGLGQGNQIAVFPDKIHGACAQFDLWHTSKNYHNRRLADAIRTWSGGNSWQQYVAFITNRTPGVTGNTVIDDAFLISPSAISFMKAQAWHEAGKQYPMSDAEWKQAQNIVFNKPFAAEPPPKPASQQPTAPAPKPVPTPKKVSKKHVAAGGSVVVGTVAAQQAHAAGFSAAIVIGIAVVAIAVAVAVWFWLTHFENKGGRRDIQ